MITWGAVALLITASPILAWRWSLRQERRGARAVPENVAVPQQAPAPPQEQHAPHAPQHKPSWAAAGGSGDQTGQIALGGRKK